jgi:hypothetical protein
MDNIQYLLHKQIDKRKWDECIDNAPNGLIYGYSFYLDAMAKHWDALVLNDYEAVMPLTWNKKYGIYYLYQPPFTASLGIFGKKITAKLIHNFLTAVPEKFKYWDIYLNYGNYFSIAGFNLYERMNYVLPLNGTYEKLYNSFNKNTKRNIKKFDCLDCIVKKKIPIDDIIILSKKQSKHFSKLIHNDFERIKKISILLGNENKSITYGSYKNGHLIASAAFFFSHKRVYYILVGNHPSAKDNGASPALINAFIKDYSGQDLLLDFEGSDIPSIAFFYSGFGAAEEKSTAIKLNKLPKIIRFLKD